MADIVGDIRGKIFANAGTSGLYAISRQLRDEDQISEAKLHQIFGAIDVKLTNSESRRFCNELPLTGDGLFASSDLLRVLRGTMAKCRKSVVTKAWTHVAGKDANQVETAVLVGAFDPSRDPLVLKGDITAEQLSNEFAGVFGTDAVVTQAEFDDYYAGVSATYSEDDAFVISVTKDWRLDQPSRHRPNELEGRVKQGFRASAYWGADGSAPPPPKEHLAQHRDTMRFATMISNDIDPFPMGKAGSAPAVTLGSYSTTQTLMNNKTRCYRGGHEMSQSLPAFDGEKSSYGKVPNGMHDARGFLTHESTNNSTIGKGHFDEDPMETFNRGKAKEREHEANRLKLASTPFQSTNPNEYYRSTQDHAPALAASRQYDPSISVHSKSSPPGPGTNTLNSSGVAGGTPIGITGRRSSDLERTLQDSLLQKKEASLPRNNRKPSGANMWSTTQRSHFAEYDCKAAEEMNHRHATKPVSHKSEEMTPDGEEYVKAVDARHALRHEGRYTTEGSEKLQDRFAEGEVDHSHDVPGTFYLSKTGIRQMQPIAHHPRETHTGETYTHDNTVPSHFMSTNANLGTFTAQRQARGY